MQNFILLSSLEMSQNIATSFGERNQINAMEKQQGWLDNCLSGGAKIAARTHNKLAEGRASEKSSVGFSNLDVSGSAQQRPHERLHF
jgi:hypothetical protein